MRHLYQMEAAMVRIRRAAVTAGAVGAWFAASVCAAQPAPAAAPPVSPADRVCGPEAARIMVLGAYHMDNPGLDAHNMKADDVLSPRRQGEIAEVVERLARYAPTKVMLEQPYGNPAIQRAYERYVAGERELGRNEVEQIGFRLAKRLGLPRVHPIDFPMRMSGLRPDEVDDSWRPKPAAAPAPGPAQPRPPSAVEKEVAESQALLQRSTVREFLARGNDPARAEREHTQFYMPLFRPADSAALYEQTDLMTNWHKRNFRMFANVVRGTDFPGDRVLLIVGSGHLKILRDLAVDADYFCLVEPNAYLR